MENPILSCEYIPTKTEKSWTYDEYYIGERDDEKRRNGKGENHWSGAKSLERYHGWLMRDTMHGVGEYRWRYLGHQGTHFTYEGNFYCNRMHGYGTMSYPDGKVFKGLFHSNLRWGPGVESQACLKQDVGLWRGTQLIRLTWRPQTPSVMPDLCMNPASRAIVESHRVILSARSRTIGKTNSAIDLLKQCGSDPLSATEKWGKLYPKNCTDLASLLCYAEAFERSYYKGKLVSLEEANDWSESDEETSEGSTESNPEMNAYKTYYAWNNNKVLTHMMKHSFTHDKQRNRKDINLTHILSGQRHHFKQAGKHELDCRTLLMACYLGHIQNVVQLINEEGINPDVADSQGNTAVMYAACGDRAEIIHFLVEAGANVDSYNDSCCTPLGVALIRLACVQKDISYSGMLQALLPPPIVPAPPPKEQRVFDWCIERSETVPPVGAMVKSPSRLSKTKVKAETSSKDIAKKTDTGVSKSPGANGSSSDDSFTEDKRLYYNISSEFSIRVGDLFSIPSAVNPIPYLFEVCDMVKAIDIPDEEPKKVPDKGTKKVPSKVIKDTMKPSKEAIWPDKEDASSINSVEKRKEDTLARITLTILQLLADGANPKLVTCPQPALFTAIVSQCHDLIKHLVNYGADINEAYPMTFDYTPLDIAVSRPLSYETLAVTRAILECGGNPNHRLFYEEPVPVDSVPPENRGPSLLHAVLAKKSENEIQDEVLLKLLELLLDYNCNPLIQFRGRSAVDIALTKNVHLLDVFIVNPTTNLNAVINEANQTILVKIFSMPFFKTVASADRLQTLTTLLLFGADPLLECRNGEEVFSNIFVFAKKTLAQLENMTTKPVSAAKPDVKKVKEDPKKSIKKEVVTKSSGKIATDDSGDYKQAMDLVVECARMLHVRWLQAKLLKELVEIIDKFKHRQWNMVMKEHNHKKSVRLWLNPQRCLEIWDILKNTKKRIYNDNRTLKYLLYIVTYYNSKSKISPSTKLTAEEKHSIDISVGRLLKERQSMPQTDVVPWKRPYVKPELTRKADESKFNICFECALPFEQEKIECPSCKLVSFCSQECMRANVDRANCHPCSDYLKQKFFPTPSESEVEILNHK